MWAVTCFIEMCEFKFYDNGAIGRKLKSKQNHALTSISINFQCFRTNTKFSKNRINKMSLLFHILMTKINDNIEKLRVMQYYLFHKVLNQFLQTT